MRVTLYTLSSGCPLCEDARAHLDRLAGKVPFELVVVPVDRDTRLLLRYALRAPVLEIESREVLFGKMSLEQVEAALKDAARSLA
jgi:hypothetical protein